MGLRKEQISNYNLLSWRRASTEYSNTFSHIVDEWLEAETSGIGNLLHRKGVNNLHQLRAYIKNPGLGTASIMDDEGYERSLSSEQHEELNGVFSYMNHLQNQWGPPATTSMEMEVLIVLFTRNGNNIRCEPDRLIPRLRIPFVDVFPSFWVSHSHLQDA